MFQGARVALVLDAALSFCRRLDSGQRLFTVDVQFEGAGVVLQPSTHAFAEALRRLWRDALQAVSSVPVLFNAGQFKNLVGASVQSQSLEDIVSKSGMFRERTDHIKTVICQQLPLAEDVGDEIIASWRLLKQYGTRMSVGDQLELETLTKRRVDLDEVKLPQAKLHLESMSHAPDIVVTVDMSPRGEHDWSLTCSNMGGDELAKFNLEMQHGAVAGVKDIVADRLGVPSHRLQLVQVDGQLLTDTAVRLDSEATKSRSPSKKLVQRRSTTGSGLGTCGDIGAIVTKRTPR